MSSVMIELKYITIFFLKQYHPALFHYETTNTIAKINVDSLHSCKPQVFRCRNFKKLQLYVSLGSISVLCCLFRHKNHMVRVRKKHDVLA